MDSTQIVEDVWHDTDRKRREQNGFDGVIMPHIMESTVLKEKELVIEFYDGKNLVNSCKSRNCVWSADQPQYL